MDWAGPRLEVVRLQRSLRRVVHLLVRYRIRCPSALIIMLSAGRWRASYLPFQHVPVAYGWPHRTRRYRTVISDGRYADTSKRFEQHDGDISSRSINPSPNP